MIDANSSNKVILFGKITVMSMEWNKIIEIKSSDRIHTKACNLQNFVHFRSKNIELLKTFFINVFHFTKRYGFDLFHLCFIIKLAALTSHFPPFQPHTRRLFTKAVRHEYMRCLRGLIDLVEGPLLTPQIRDLLGEARQIIEELGEES